jgi:hypothetical protein
MNDVMDLDVISILIVVMARRAREERYMWKFEWLGIGLVFRAF